MKKKTIELILKIVINISEILKDLLFNNNKDKEGKKNDNNNSNKTH